MKFIQKTPNTGGCSGVEYRPFPPMSVRVGLRTEGRMARITVVNDHAEFLALMVEILEAERHEVTFIDGDLPGDLEAIIASRPELLVIDLRMGTDKLHGWDIAQQIRRQSTFNGLPVVICSGDVLALKDLEVDLSETMRTAALRKPFAINELTTLVSAMLGEAEPTTISG